MAWCCQATSHYLSQCWPRSLSSYGVTRPQWVKPIAWFLAATKQLYKWFSPSVCPSVCPSVHHTFLTMFPSSYCHEIYQWQKWCPCKRSRSEVKGQGHRGTQHRRFGTATLVWIHWWLWNDARRLKQPRKGALLFFKVIRQISWSHGTKIRRFWPELSVSRL